MTGAIDAAGGEELREQSSPRRGEAVRGREAAGSTAADAPRADEAAGGNGGAGERVGGSGADVGRDEVPGGGVGPRTEDGGAAPDLLGKDADGAAPRSERTTTDAARDGEEEISVKIDGDASEEADNDDVTTFPLQKENFQGDPGNDAPPKEGSRMEVPEEFSQGEDACTAEQEGDAQGHEAALSSPNNNSSPVEGNAEKSLTECLAHAHEPGREEPKVPPSKRSAFPSEDSVLDVLVPQQDETTDSSKSDRSAAKKAQGNQPPDPSAQADASSSLQRDPEPDPSLPNGDTTPVEARAGDLMPLCLVQVSEGGEPRKLESMNDVCTEEGSNPAKLPQPSDIFDPKSEISATEESNHDGKEDFVNIEGKAHDVDINNNNSNNSDGEVGIEVEKSTGANDVNELNVELSVSDDAGDSEFVAIELVSPKGMDAEGDGKSPRSTMDHPVATRASAPSERVWEDPDDPDLVRPVLPSPTNGDNSNPARQLPSRRRIAHPILTSLARLPWDRFVSAAGACDLLFNCKYSMRQVEAELQKERRHGGSAGGCGGGSNAGATEEWEDAIHDRVGRGDGYVAVSLGNGCDDEGAEQGGEEEEGCDEDDFAHMGLDCCSMLDDEPEEEVEVVMYHGRGGDDQEMEGLGRVATDNRGDKDAEDVEVGQWEELADQRGSGGGCERPLSATASGTAARDLGILREEQRAEESWKNSNPTLDMMLYRTLINE